MGFGSLLLALLAAVTGSPGGAAAETNAKGDRAGGAVVRSAPLRWPIVFVQLPVGSPAERQSTKLNGTLRADYGRGARLVLLSPNGSLRVLSSAFHSATDPDVSFDGKRLLFSAKKTANDPWNVYEMTLRDGKIRQITRGLGDCRSPRYQSTLFTLDSPEPWYQIAFVSTAAGTMNEQGSGPSTDLYSCKLDGTQVRRLTYNLSNDLDPRILPDGRMVLSCWQRRTLAAGLQGRVRLFGVNIDGTDYALLADPRGKRVKHMACGPVGGLIVFVETDQVPWDGAGRLAAVTWRRPLRSYRPLTKPADGLFHSPAPLPDGSILVARRAANSSASHALWRLDLATGRRQLVFDDARYHDFHAQVVYPRTEPDGRSTVVEPTVSLGKFYCLSVFISDLPREQFSQGIARRLRVLEGVPLRADRSDQYLPADEGWPPGSTVHGIPPLVPRRILGNIPIEADGSFHIQVPANIPIELQLLDENGMALRSCGWIWARNRERRGCIGCHEDGELVPENWFVDAVAKPAVRLTLPPEKRRAVDFRRDVGPIIERKCLACHGPGGDPPCLAEPAAANRNSPERFSAAYRALLAGESGEDRFRTKYVVPGAARKSRLIWHLLGRNTARPWDGPLANVPAKPIASKPGLPVLTEDEILTFIEWVDLGALWDGAPPGGEQPSGTTHRTTPHQRENPE